MSEEKNINKRERRGSTINRGSMKEYIYADIEAATDNFSLANLIGKGSHGTVYKGTLPSGELIAVKKPSPHNPTSNLDTELSILTSINSPHILPLLGLSHSHSHDSSLLIMELMPNNSLHDLLHSSPSPPSYPRRAAIALSLAHAVAALHSATPSIVHRDIKPANVLFNRRMHAKLADFSLAVVRCEKELPLPAGTIGYLDPCYTTPDKLSTENDVYSLGVVLLELVSGRRALDVEREPAGVVAWAVPMVVSGRREEVWDRRVAMPVGMEAAVGRMLGVAVRCVSGKRPGVVEVVEVLERVVEEIRWRGLVMRRVFGCVQGWRRHTARIVRTKKIVCTEHIGDGGNSGDNKSGNELELA